MGVGVGMGMVVIAMEDADVVVSEEDTDVYFGLLGREGCQGKRPSRNRCMRAWV